MQDEFEEKRLAKVNERKKRFLAFIGTDVKKVEKQVEAQFDKTGRVVTTMYIPRMQLKTKFGPVEVKFGNDVILGDLKFE